MYNWNCLECHENYSCGDCEHNPCECDSEDSGYMPNRMYSAEDLPQFQSTEAGKIITSQRVFSAEIECYAEDESAANKIARLIPKAVGITDDGSLSDYGIELQTPKLKGKNGEQCIKDVCKVLNTQGATITKDCGLHIHLDGKGLLPRTLTTVEPTALKQLWQFYVAFDDVMLSFLPKSRRTNSFCRSMKDTAKYNHIGNAKTQRDIEVLWYKTSNVSYLNQNKSHQKHGSRYHGVNIHILLAEKHLEIRFHSGTINATKMLEWTAMHQRICDMAASNTLITSEAMLDLDLERKTKMFFTILGLPARAEKYFTRRQTQFAPKIEKEEKKLRYHLIGESSTVTIERDTNNAEEDVLEVAEALN